MSCRIGFLFCVVVLLLPMFGSADEPEKPGREELAALKMIKKLIGDAGRLQNEGRTREAISVAEKALHQTTNVYGDEHPVTAHALVLLTSLYYSDRQFAKAEPLGRRSLEIREKVRGTRHAETAQSMSMLAGIYAATGAYAKAEPLCRKSLEIRKAVLGDENPMTVGGMTNLATVYEGMGEYAKAEPLYREALDIYKKVFGKNHPSVASCLNGLAGLYRAIGDYANAEIHCRDALAVRKGWYGEEHAETARSLSNLAMLYVDMGEPTKAESLFQQSLEIQKKTLPEDHGDLAGNFGGLAGIYLAMGDFAKAESNARRCLEIRKGTLGDDHPNTAQSLQNLAYLCDLMEKDEEAETNYLKALDVYRRVLGETHHRTADCIAGLAGLNLSTGNYSKARTLYQQALDIREEVFGKQHPESAGTRRDLALTYFSSGDYTNADRECRKVLDMEMNSLGNDHPNTGKTRRFLGTILFAAGNTKDAKLLLQQGLRLHQKNVVSAYSIQSERQQFQYRENQAINLDMWFSLPTDDVNAAECCEQALNWKGTVYAAQARIHDLTESEVTGPILAKLQHTSRLLASHAFSAPDPQRPDAWHLKLTSLATQKESQEADLAKSSMWGGPRWVTARELGAALRSSKLDNPAFVDLIEYSHIIPPANEREEWQSERRLLGFVVRPDSDVKRVEFGRVQPIESAIEDWRGAVRGKSSRASSNTCAKLRQLLWDPLATHLDGVRTLLISPDGAVGRIPWAALPGRNPSSFLIEEISVAVIPAPHQLADLLGTAGQPGREGPLLAIGDVNYHGHPGTADRAALTYKNRGVPAFPMLTNTGTEVDEIKRSFRARFPAGTLVTLSKDAASESAVRESVKMCRYLHLATHGFFAPAGIKSALEGKSAGITSLFGHSDVMGFHPGLFSGLALTGANTPLHEGQDDGILTALEVATLDLRSVDLAVLSACDTGLGPVAGGEGLLGLQRAFHVAGARNVIASLWQVDDEATAALMKAFYHNLWIERKTPLAALRDAQLFILHHPEQISKLANNRGPDFSRLLQVPKSKGPVKKQKTAPPRLWAGFVLSGPGR